MNNKLKSNKSYLSVIYAMILLVGYASLCGFMLFTPKGADAYREITGQNQLK